MAINDFLGPGERVNVGPKTQAGKRAQARRDASNSTEVSNLSSDEQLREFHQSIGGGRARYKSLASYEDPDARDPRGRDQRNVVSPATESNTTLPSQNQPSAQGGGTQTVSNRPYIATNPLDDRYDFRTGQKVHTLSNATAALSAQRGVALGGANVNTPQGQADPDSFDPRGRDQRNTPVPPPAPNTPTYEPVDPRPTGLTSEEREERVEWDKKYRLTHKPDGQPLTQYDISIDAFGGL
jgi:hypothetical protein